MNKELDFFKPEDFEETKDLYGFESYADRELAAKIVNNILDKHLESCPVVYGNNFKSNDGSAFDIGSVWNITKLNDKTHKARLFGIEEIKKEPCKHEPLEEIKHTVCKHCGVHLDAEWMVK